MVDFHGTERSELQDNLNSLLPGYEELQPTPSSNLCVYEATSKRCKGDYVQCFHFLIQHV